MSVSEKQAPSYLPKEGKIYVTNNLNETATVAEREDLYYVKEIQQKQTNMVEKTSKLMLMRWHERLGHFNEKNLKNEKLFLA